MGLVLRWRRRITLGILLAACSFVLAACATADTATSSHGKYLTSGAGGVYTGPLLGWHEIRQTVPLFNASDTPLQLIAATPANPSNVHVRQAVVVPAHLHDLNAPTIVGALRWPRSVGEKIRGIDVLKAARSVGRQLVPGKADGQVLVSVLLEQNDASKSVMDDGISVTYEVDGTRYIDVIPLGLCFTTPSDTKSCKA